MSETYAPPDTKIVRVNGSPWLVPEDELTDPHRDRGTGGCDAGEPAGGAVCTLAPHDPAIAHIAHDGEGDVIAMWGDPDFTPDA